jgi:hypothetical protein
MKDDMNWIKITKKNYKDIPSSDDTFFTWYDDECQDRGIIQGYCSIDLGGRHNICRQSAESLFIWNDTNERFEHSDEREFPGMFLTAYCILEPFRE